MAGKVDEFISKLSKSLILHPYPILHGFRNCVPAPFSSYAWREIAYESVRQTARESVDPLSELDPLAVLWRRAGRTNYGTALRNLRRCQRFIAWCLFCLIITTEKTDSTDENKTTGLQNTLFFAMWMFVLVYVWSHVSASTALYESSKAKHQLKPTLAWTASMAVIASFLLHGAAYDGHVHSDTTARRGDATARRGMIVIAIHVLICICLDWVQPGPANEPAIVYGEKGDYGLYKKGVWKGNEEELVGGVARNP